MQIHHTPFHVVVASGGLVIIGVDVATNVDFMVTQAGTFYDTSVAAVMAVALGTSLALAAAFRALRQWKIVTALILLCGFALGAAFSLTATLDRVATLRDRQLSTIWDADPELRKLRGERDQARQDAATECSPQRGGRGKLCGMAEERVAKVIADVRKREAELDPLGRRIAAIWPGVTPEQASTYQPLLLPAALFILGNWLFAFGMGGQRRKPEFEITLSRRDQLEQKASRFAVAFEQQQGRLPAPADLQRSLGVSRETAKRLAQRIGG